MTINNKILNVEKVYWEDVRLAIKNVNPVLFKIIDKISPDKKYPLYKATYPYSHHILKSGKFYLPAKDSTLVTLDDARLEKGIRDDLVYSRPTVPVLIVLKKPLELFVTLHNRVIPYFLIYPGSMYGVWKILDARASRFTSYAPDSIWDLTSGARSVFMLPKISEKSGHHRLQKFFDFTHDKPDDLRDHWKIFSAVASHESIEKKWESEVLFFSKKWFSRLDDDEWRELSHYLLEFNWSGSEYWRSQFAWNLAFSRIHTARHITPNPYHVDIVKHLLAIATGALPGFAPAINDHLGPMSVFQKAYVDVYRLSEWAPIIMQPHFYNMREAKRPVYYSLQYPSSIELSPSSNKRASVIEDTYMSCSLLEKYLQDLESGTFDIDSTTLYEITQLVKFDFYHSDAGGYSKIKNNRQLAKIDKTFSTLLYERGSGEFPKNSTFFKGCIQLHSG